ncbi:MAG TPA: OmpA family protein [Dyella sp.]|uniref:OmpA family protein n=1 Tax=Dyella sp. TaxID=1869338 RepID=UPI002D789145|nr:OmpA family protein [Dyella sp.]HET6555135.1 OmpA family protein [Dyella sp.]
MKSCAMALALVGLLAGCASHRARDRLDVQDPTVLQAGTDVQQGTAAGAPTREWFGRYQGMHARTMLPDLHQRLAALGSRATGYDGAKAQCWIDAADEEYRFGNQWGFVQEAMGEADRLLDGLKGKQAIAAGNAKLRTVARLRPDVWATLDAARRKADGRADCDEAQRIIACSEVQLMHAGHEAWRRSFDKAEKRVDALTPAVNALDERIDRCPASKAAEVATPTTRTFKADALFRFDRGDEAGLLPEGKRELDRLLADLKQTALQRIDIVGHTDRLGRDAYNDRLSAQRAATVRDYLASHGMSAMPMHATGEGKRIPVVECNLRRREELIACLEPNRRVEVRLFVREE